LFDRDVKTIGKHIANVLKEELRSFSVVANFATTASDGKVYQVEHYSLDMIISVGYRVKSQRGIQFRIWANKVLKEYLLKGYVVNHRLVKIENDVFYLKKKVDDIDFLINTNIPPNEGIFYDGQIFLIIDNAIVYHIGASLKDLGKKWFAFSKIELNATEMIRKLI